MIRYLIRQARGDQNPPAPSRRELRRQQRNNNNGYAQDQQNAYPPNQAGYPQTTLNDPSSQAHGATQPDLKSKWKEWLPRLRLVGAVFLPVILETLDYTGTS